MRKKCGDCGKRKDAKTEFYQYKGQPRSLCIVCYRRIYCEKRKEWYQLHKDDPKFKDVNCARTRAWKKANAAYVAEQRRTPEYVAKRVVYDRNYYQKHKEEIQARRQRRGKL